MARLDASPTPIDVVPGVRLTAPTLRGEVLAHRASADGTRSTEVEDPTDALLEAMASQDLREVLLLEVRASSVADSGAGGTRRGDVVGDRDTVTLEVPDLGDTVGQVVMAVHDGGVITWHPPVESSNSAGAQRGGGATRFRIELPEAGARDASQEVVGSTQRGLLGLAGRTLLKVLVFPVASRIAGRATMALASNWESDHRPHRLRWFGPGDDRRNGKDVDDAGLDHLAGGRSLVLVHGTFSTAASGFSQLPDDLLGRLHHSYGGRVVALDHPSLSASPQDNVAWLQDRLGDRPPLDVDLLTHSRGGLVGRAMAGHLGEVRGLAVGTVVLGATPNQGTPLANPKHVVSFLDRSTTLLNLFPPGPPDVVQLVLEGVLTAVKAIVGGGLATLPGLSAMDPEGQTVADLSAFGAGTATLRAIAADFEPTGPLAVAFLHRVKDAVVHRVKDAVVDRVMGDQANDMVVPTAGVSGTRELPTGLVAEPLVFATADGVHHSSIFAQPRTAASLETWLVGT